ncbi:MAG: hypothetical protein KatS3mg108_2789 [Isosphaeraceae bacterium]|jgi:DUF971 family protein|nr:MAG: hypothetical protein KatS3mg108_2789 [Isosphaeraceae bacterium]
MSMTEPPVHVRAIQAEQVLELGWEGGPVERVPYRHLRANCPCASCKDEWTGERILDPATIRADLKLEGMEAVGNYAVRLVWNDGHGSGLFTWETLRELASSGAGEGRPRWRGIDPPDSGSVREESPEI